MYCVDFIPHVTFRLSSIFIAIVLKRFRDAGFLCLFTVSKFNMRVFQARSQCWLANDSLKRKCCDETESALWENIRKRSAYTARDHVIILVIIKVILGLCWHEGIQVWFWPFCFGVFFVVADCWWYFLFWFLYIFVVIVCFFSSIWRTC